MRAREFVPRAWHVTVNGDPGILTRNTTPGEQPWRVTWFDREDHEPNGHKDLSLSQARQIQRGNNIEVEDQDVIYYIDAGEELAENSLFWRQYPCTKDCSGHQAGDSWAQARGITDVTQCPPGNSNSWWEGCKSEAEKRPY